MVEFTSCSSLKTRSSQPFNLDHVEMLMLLTTVGKQLDWLKSFKQFFINVSYNILVASLTLMALS